MCFSEEASFTAAVVLGAVAVYCFRTVKGEPSYYALAAIPLIFALQQALEGFQWIYLKGIWKSDWGVSVSRNLFLAIAMVVWPVWIPFSVWLAEKQPGRKKVLLVLTFLGFLVAIYDFNALYFSHAEATIVDRSIRYWLSLPKHGFWPYALAVIVPLFVSSLPKASWAGVILVLAAFATDLIYREVFLSLWCFFAALISLMTLYLLRQRHLPQRL